MVQPPDSYPIRLRTLMTLRWVAIFGQSAAVAGAWGLGVRFPLTAVLALIAVALVFNIALALRPGRKLTANAAAGQLGFDIVQLSALIALTGGMTNPFAALTLAPVTIAATALPTRHAVGLAVLAGLMLSFCALVYEPLSLESGHVLSVEAKLRFGHWLSLIIGVGFFSAYASRVSGELRATNEALFATRLALAREHKLQQLGGVVAATAHEMGTPLGTIRLIASELRDELSEMLHDRRELAEDLNLLDQSVERCRAALRSMGQAGRDDILARMSPFPTMVAEAAEPHSDRGTHIELIERPSTPAPVVRRDPGVIHGLRNIIQNAVDFAKNRVEISMSWSETRLEVQVRDDGPGISHPRLDEMGTEPSQSASRPGYEGMGLGLFIARTLLEASGATVRFQNDGGAVVTIDWPLSALTAQSRAAMGENPLIHD